MKANLLLPGVVCFIGAFSLWGQSALVSTASVSFYELSHRPDKQARRLFNEGNAHLKRRDYAHSLKLFEEAISLDPNYWAAENNLGYSYLQLAQDGAAERAFRRAIEIDPRNPVAYANVSLVALTRNQFPVAESFARSALRLNPNFNSAKALLALAEVGQGNWSLEAYKLLEEGQAAIPGSERVLRKWPTAGSEAPRIAVVSSDLRK